MNGNHITLGTVLGAAVALLVERYARVDKTTAVLFGSAAAGVATQVVHSVATQGLIPAVRRVFRGPPKPV